MKRTLNIISSSLVISATLLACSPKLKSSDFEKVATGTDTSTAPTEEPGVVKGPNVDPVLVSAPIVVIPSTPVSSVVNTVTPAVSAPIETVDQTVVAVAQPVSQIVADTTSSAASLLNDNQNIVTVQPAVEVIHEETHAIEVPSFIIDIVNQVSSHVPVTVAPSTPVNETHEVVVEPIVAAIPVIEAQIPTATQTAVHSETSVADQAAAPAAHAGVAETVSQIQPANTAAVPTVSLPVIEVVVTAPTLSQQEQQAMPAQIVDVPASTAPVVGTPVTPNPVTESSPAVAAAPAVSNSVATPAATQPAVAAPVVSLPAVSTPVATIPAASQTSDNVSSIPVSSNNDDLDVADDDDDDDKTVTDTKNNGGSDISVKGSCKGKKKVALVWKHSKKSHKKGIIVRFCVNDTFEFKIKNKKNRLKMFIFQTALF